MEQIKFENIFRNNNNFKLIKIFKITEKTYTTLFKITNVSNSNMTIVLDKWTRNMYQILLRKHYDSLYL